MSFQTPTNKTAYGFNNPIQTLSPEPIIANRAPSTSDIAEFGQLWVYDNMVWVFTSAQTWTELASDSGDATFDALTVNGTSTFNGTIDAVTGNEPITLDSGTGTISISGDAAATTVGIANGAGVKGVTLGSTNGASSTLIESGTGGVVVNSNGTGNILLTAVNTSIASLSFTNNARIGSTSITVPTNIIATGTATIVMTNSYIASLSTPVICTVTTNATGGGYLQVNGMVNGLSGDTLTIYVTNAGSATIPASTSNIIVSFMVLE